MVKNIPGQVLNNDQVIWRYMGFISFYSLLEKRCLFFRRLDKYSDAYEGTLPVETLAEIRQIHTQSGFETPEQIDQFLKGMSTLHQLRMNEDPVFYKKLSQLIRETIDAYHAGRLNEVEYLNKVTSYERDFTTRRQDNLPGEIADNDIQIAFYNQANAILETTLKDNAGRMQIAASISVGIDDTIRNIIFDQGAMIIDWEHNNDIQGKLRIALDDYLFDAKAMYRIAITDAEIDLMEDECLKIAKTRYK